MATINDLLNDHAMALQARRYQEHIDDAYAEARNLRTRLDQSYARASDAEMRVDLLQKKVANLEASLNSTNDQWKRSVAEFMFLWGMLTQALRQADPDNPFSRVEQVNATLDAMKSSIDELVRRPAKLFANESFQMGLQLTENAGVGQERRAEIDADRIVSKYAKAGNWTFERFARVRAQVANALLTQKVSAQDVEKMFEREIG